MKQTNSAKEAENREKKAVEMANQPVYQQNMQMGAMGAQQPANFYQQQYYQQPGAVQPGAP